MKQIFLLSFVVLLFSCKKESTNVSFTQVFGIQDYEKAKKELGMYVNYGTYTDGVAKLAIDNVPNTTQFNGEFFAKYRPEPNQARGDGGTYIVDDLKATYKPEGFYTADGITSTEGAVFTKYFGKENRFSLNRENKIIYDKTIYIPSQMKLSSFPNTGLIKLTSFYGISRNAFDFKWNVDTNNKYGIIVVLTWGGDKRNGGLDQGANKNFYYKAAWMPDIGEGNLPTSFFDNVPKDAIFTLEFIRANIEIVTGTDNRSYKIYGISQETKSCSLQD